MKELADRGFEIRSDLIEEPLLRSLEVGVKQLFKLHFRKVLPGLKIAEDLSNEVFFDWVRTADRQYPREMYEFCKLVRSSSEAIKVHVPEIIDLAADVLECSASAILIDGPNFFINVPDQERLLYKWHTEVHYYPKRKKFLNLWIPLFGNRNEDNGAMEMLPFSHKSSFSFVEYKGFSRRESQDAMTFLQFEVPEEEVQKYDPVTVSVNRGEVLLFDKNLVHRSSPNISGQPAFTFVSRLWSCESDHTMAADMAVKPYTGQDLACPAVANFINDK